MFHVTSAFRTLPKENSKMSIKVGDRVRFLSDTGEGLVVKILDEYRVMVEDESGFEYEHQIKDLLAVGARADEKEKYDLVEPDINEIIHRNMDVGAVEKADKDFTVKYKNRDATNSQRRGEHMEIDLHIHELVDNENGLDNGDKLEIQLGHFERMLKRAEEQKVSKVIFIHGVGQGVLRGEIRKIIENYYPKASFHDADFREYGYGATEVRISR
jgi:dsDNA-specific endonuclease/ATPase MutS2